MIRVVLVEDHPSLRAALVTLLAEQHDMVVAGVCGDGTAAVDMVLRERPHLVLVDLRLRQPDGVEVTRRIIRAWPDARIAIYADAPTSHQADSAAASGAICVITKGMDTDHLLDAIRAAAEGASI
jgi:DNA-binding NarL/FixJ family response regulator